MISQVSSLEPHVDILIIGGGPAGSACALRSLALQGQRRVLILDRVQFPRFHIGESMIPYSMATLEHLGVLEGALAALRPVPKHGVESSWADGTYQRFDFDLVAEGQHAHAYNFERAKLDAYLLDAARARGADVWTETTATGLLFDGGRVVGVTYEREGKTGELRARHVIDASGRTGLIATRHLRSRRVNRRLNNVAVFQHYVGVRDDDLPPACERGDIMIGSSCPEGWMWAIQIADDVLSVGAVVPARFVRESSPGEVFEAWMKRCPRIAARVRSGKPVFDPLRVESDYCYHSNQLAGPGFLIVGDAGCFVDPLYSGGFNLALATGVRAAETALGIDGGREEAEARLEFERFSKTGYDTYYRLIYSIMDVCDGMVPRYVEPEPPLGTGYPAPVAYKVQLVAGDFWGHPDAPLLNQLRANRAWDTFEDPFEPLTGCPVYGDHCYSPANPPDARFMQRVLNGGVVRRDPGGEVLRIVPRQQQMASGDR